MMTAVLASLEWFGALLIFVCGVIAFDAMSARTKHYWRGVYGAMTVSALALLLEPIFRSMGELPEGSEVRGVAHVVLAVSVAVHLVLDRRRIRHHNEQAAGKRSSVSGVVVVVAIGVVVLQLFGIREAHAATVPTEWCKPQAVFAKAIAEVRDLGADVDKHLAQVRGRLQAAEASPVQRQVMEQLVRRVYADRRRGPDLIEMSTYARCIEAHGDMGTET